MYSRSTEKRNFRAESYHHVDFWWSDGDDDESFHFSAIFWGGLVSQYPPFLMQQDGVRCNANVWDDHRLIQDWVIESSGSIWKNQKETSVEIQVVEMESIYVSHMVHFKEWQRYKKRFIIM